MSITKELKKWLEENKKAVKSPSRPRYRQYNREERLLLARVFGKDTTPEQAAEANEALEKMQDDFIAEVYPDFPDPLPADIFRDLLVATVSKGNGNLEKN